MVLLLLLLLLLSDAHHSGFKYQTAVLCVLCVMFQAEPSFVVNLLDVFLARLPNISLDPYGRNVNCFSRTRSYRAVNTLRLRYNSHGVNVVQGKLAAYPELHTKHINVLCREKDFFF